MSVRGIAGKKDPAKTVTVSYDTLDHPVTDADDVGIEVRQLQQLAHAGDQRRLVEARRIIRSKTEMKHPFLRMTVKSRRSELAKYAAAPRPAVRIHEPCRHREIVVPPLGKVRAKIDGHHIDQVGRSEKVAAHDRT